MQLQYSLIERTIEREHLPMSRELDLAVTAWGPLGSGLLTGKYSGISQPTEEDGRLGHESARAGGFHTERNVAIAEAVGEIAEETGATPAQVAIAWLLTRPGQVIPIVGARKESQLRDNLGALDVELTPEQLARLEELSRVDLGFPTEFLEGQKDDGEIFGEMYRQIDDHRALARSSSV